MDGINFNKFITLTTSLPFTSASNILRAKELLGRFRLALKYKAPGVRFVWGIGLTKSNLMHFHLLATGDVPSKTWIHKKWHKISGYTHTHATDAQEAHKYYLARNLSEIPDFSEVYELTLADCNSLKNFRRFGYSEGLLPRPAARPKSNQFMWTGFTYGDAGNEQTASDFETWTTFGTKAK